MIAVDALIRAIDESGRSDRSISFAAVGHYTAVASLRRNGNLTVSTAAALCRELGLEIYIGPPRIVPAAISQALGLAESCDVEDALVAIALRSATSDEIQQLRRAVADLAGIIRG